MDKLKQLACDAIDQSSSHLKDLSDAIWNLKELSFQEHKSHTTLTQFLEDRGFQVERNYKLDTAFVATWGKSSHTPDQKLPHIAFICEYDALPEVGHACGHNLIAEIGVGAGLAVKDALEKDGRQLGKISILGTPAEEDGGGKIHLINAGVFDDVDVAMMAHPAPFTDARPIFLGARPFTAKFKGQASHAAGFPWEGVNALDAAVLSYTNIAVLRQQMKPLWRAGAIISKGGVRANIIPDDTEMQCTVRAPTDSELTTIESKVKSCINAAALATGCTVEVKDPIDSYECLITNETLARLYETNGRLVGVSFDHTGTKQILGSTDMGNVSHVVPGLHPTYDIGTDNFNHTRDFAADAASASAQPPTLAQAKALAMVALDILQTPELLSDIRKNFKADLDRM